MMYLFLMLGLLPLLLSCSNPLSSLSSKPKPVKHVRMNPIIDYASLTRPPETDSEKIEEEKKDYIKAVAPVEKLPEEGVKIFSEQLMG
jgi:hypothetical protein